MAASGGKQVWIADHGFRLAVCHAPLPMEATRPKCGRRFRSAVTGCADGHENRIGFPRARFHSIDAESARLHVQLESPNYQQGFSRSYGKPRNTESFPLRFSRDQPVVAQTSAMACSVLSLGPIRIKHFSPPRSLLSRRSSVAVNLLRNSVSRAVPPQSCAPVSLLHSDVVLHCKFCSAYRNCKIPDRAQIRQVEAGPKAVPGCLKQAREQRIAT